MSKTVEELFEEVRNDEKLQKDLSEALQKDKESVISFMRDNGCEASIDEAKEFLNEVGKKAIDNGELTPEQLEKVSGGTLATPIMELFGGNTLWAITDK